MAVSERRITRRLKLHVPLRFHGLDMPAENDCAATSINISGQGVYFETSLALTVGQAVEIKLRMPSQFAEGRDRECCFTGRVMRIESMTAQPGCSGIGVHFLYYEPV